jgi:hypothetical protein
MSRFSGIGRLYKPVFFWNQFNSVVNPWYESYLQSIKIDEKGLRWKLVRDYDFLLYNLGNINSVQEEDQLRRDLMLKILVKDRVGLKGFGRLIDHGWRTSSSLTYFLVMEKELDSIVDILRQEKKHLLP